MVIFISHNYALRKLNDSFIMHICTRTIGILNNNASPSEDALAIVNGMQFRRFDAFVSHSSFMNFDSCHLSLFIVLSQFHIFPTSYHSFNR